MTDPLAQIVGLLQPRAPFSKCVTGSGSWRVRRTQSPNPYYVAALKGSLRYRDQRSGEVTVNAGDFILIPSAQDFMIWSDAPSDDSDMVVDPVILPGGAYRVGSIDGPIDMRALVGYCIFQSDDASLLSSLLPELVVVRGEYRLAMLMQLLASAIRGMHAKPERGWTAAELARESALSRSGFHERFQIAVGMAPMEYLTAWRLALAKDLLRKRLQRGICA